MFAVDPVPISSYALLLLTILICRSQPLVLADRSLLLLLLLTQHPPRSTFEQPVPNAFLSVLCLLSDKQNKTDTDTVEAGVDPEQGRTNEFQVSFQQVKDDLFLEDCSFYVTHPSNGSCTTPLQYGCQQRNQCCYSICCCTATAASTTIACRGQMQIS